MFAGSVSDDNSCKMGPFSDGYNSYPYATVQDVVTISLSTAFGMYALATDRVRLPSGVTCARDDVNAGACEK